MAKSLSWEETLLKLIKTSRIRQSRLQISRASSLLSKTNALDCTRSTQQDVRVLINKFLASKATMKRWTGEFPSRTRSSKGFGGSWMTRKLKKRTGRCYSKQRSMSWRRPKNRLNRNLSKWRMKETSFNRNLRRQKTLSQSAIKITALSLKDSVAYTTRS